VRVLSRVFRGKFLAGLRAAHGRGDLSFHGQQSELSEPVVFRRRLDELREVEWVVYAKQPFGGAEQVLKYLARYTHRVAISNRRLVEMKDGQVSFRWKDYAHGHEEKVMTVAAVEFIRRFLLHVLPSGFVHIRHYGFLANRSREEKLPLCRALLGAGKQEATKAVPAGEAVVPDETTLPSEDRSAEEAVERRLCVACGRGQMIAVEILPRATQDAWEVEAVETAEPVTS
jgi:hypothetical protein